MRLRWRLRPPAYVVCATGKRMFLDCGDERGFALLVSNGNVNPASMTLWRGLLALRDWTVVVDVGANHGEMLLNATLPNEARVFAFEPNARLAALLRRSLAAAGIVGEVHAAAVGDAAGEIALFVDPAWSGNSTAMAGKASPGAAAMTVPQVTLAGFLADVQPPPWPGRLLLKIDVEGGEIGVLRGLLPVLDRWDEVAIMTEVHRMDTAEMAWLAEHFDLTLADPRSGRLRAASAAEAMGQDGLDAALFRRGEAAEFGVT